MSTEIINGLFSIGAALIAFSGGIIAASIDNKKKARIEKITKMEELVKQLAGEVIRYSRLEDALVGELKTWTDDYKKEIRSSFYEKLFEDGRRSLMSEKKAQSILDEYAQ